MIELSPEERKKLSEKMLTHLKNEFVGYFRYIVLDYDGQNVKFLWTPWVEDSKQSNEFGRVYYANKASIIVSVEFLVFDFNTAIKEITTKMKTTLEISSEEAEILAKVPDTIKSIFVKIPPSKN